MENKKIEIAFCIGLHKEVLNLSKILENNNFVVNSVNCIYRYLDKTQMGAVNEYKIRDCDVYKPSCKY